MDFALLINRVLYVVAMVKARMLKRLIAGGCAAGSIIVQHEQDHESKAILRNLVEISSSNFLSCKGEKNTLGNIIYIHWDRSPYKFHV